jgi:hypothetical protein
MVNPFYKQLEPNHSFPSIPLFSTKFNNNRQKLNQSLKTKEETREGNKQNQTIESICGNKQTNLYILIRFASFFWH